MKIMLKLLEIYVFYRKLIGAMEFSIELATPWRILAVN